MESILIDYSGGAAVRDRGDWQRKLGRKRDVNGDEAGMGGKAVHRLTGLDWLEEDSGGGGGKGWGDNWWNGLVKKGSAAT